MNGRTQHFHPYGKVKFTFAQDITKRKKIIIVGKKSYSLILVPPGLWFKFESLVKLSLVVNTLNNIHKTNETLKIPINV